MFKGGGESGCRNSSPLFYETKGIHMKLFDQKFAVVDLSLMIREDLPGTWPGHHAYTHESWKFFTSEQEPYATNYFCLDEHYGTHCDAPPHFIPPPDSGIALSGEAGTHYGDRLSLPQMMGKLLVIDARSLQKDGRNGISPWITQEFIQQWEGDNREAGPGDIVVFQTGFDAYYVPGEDGKKYVQYPVADRCSPGWASPSVDAISYLYERGVKCMGIDAASMGAVHDGVPSHQFGLYRDIIYIEGLANLEKVPHIGAYFMFLPIKLGNSTGCPGRAVALVEDASR